jgi:hypothetical protein
VATREITLDHAAGDTPRQDGHTDTTAPHRPGDESDEDGRQDDGCEPPRVEQPDETTDDRLYTDGTSIRPDDSRRITGR